MVGQCCVHIEGTEKLFPSNFFFLAEILRGFLFVLFCSGKRLAIKPNFKKCCNFRLSCLSMQMAAA